MGQMTFAVLFGCNAEPPTKLGDDGWQSLIESYMPKIGPMPATARDGFLGFWVACGASGKAGVPDLGSFQLSELETTQPYAAKCKQVRRAWESLETFAFKAGVILPPPAMWLVETEVA